MPVSMQDLADDLAAESAQLRAMLAPLGQAEWERATPSAGWTLGDQISHLAYFDDAAVQSAIAPDAFLAELERVTADGGLDPDGIAAAHRGRSGVELLAWFDRAREGVIDTFRRLDPSTRVPWYGPAMSAASSLTARIMETWAHGQDVADTLGVVRVPNGRLRHVAHIGIGARGYSFLVHGLAAPTSPIRVELDAPGGGCWAWGPPDAPDRIAGPALDFCLAVTQRRHRDDTTLMITGPAADEWMSIAQAFAGSAGTGRRAGEFA